MSDPTEIPAQAPQATATSPAQALAARYGTDRPRRRRVGFVLGGLLAAALLAWAVWAGTAQDNAPIEATVTSYQVVGIHEIRVQLSAKFHDPGTTGTCLVRATAADHTVVGELNLSAAELRADRGHWISIRTERRATTATVVSCTD